MTTNTTTNTTTTETLVEGDFAARLRAAMGTEHAANQRFVPIRRQLGAAAPVVVKQRGKGRAPKPAVGGNTPEHNSAVAAAAAATIMVGGIDAANKQAANWVAENATVLATDGIIDANALKRNDALAAETTKRGRAVIPYIPAEPITETLPLRDQLRIGEPMPSAVAVLKRVPITAAQRESNKAASAARYLQDLGFRDAVQFMHGSQTIGTDCQWCGTETEPGNMIAQLHYGGWRTFSRNEKDNDTGKVTRIVTHNRAHLDLCFDCGMQLLAHISGLDRSTCNPDYHPS